MKYFVILGTFGLLADKDHDNVNGTLIEEEATLSSFDSGAVNDSEWNKEDSLVLGKLDPISPGGGGFRPPGRLSLITPKRHKISK